MRSKESLIAEVRYLRSVLHNIAGAEGDIHTPLEVWELKDWARESLSISFKGQNYDPVTKPSGTKINQ